MKITKLVTIVLMLGSVGASALHAQTRTGSVPAEFPSAAYKGKQYVDSKGCVFIRAGIDGNVSWVPRVTRKRTGVCGFKPTFAGAVSAPTPVQSAASTQITNPRPAAATPAAKPRPARVAEAVPAPALKVIRQVAKRPAPILEIAPAPVIQTAQRNVSGATACGNASPIAQQYLRSGNRAIRCGPQSRSIVGNQGTTGGRYANRAASAQQPVQVASNRRIVPRHVAVNRVNTTNVKVPQGYKPVWTDDRLNPKRAEQSLAGHRAMSYVWTSSVPRRLINQADGNDVTASIPLVYPFTDFAAQQRDLGQVSIVQRNGQTLKRILRNVTNTVTPTPRQATVATVARQPTYSSRSAPKVAPKPKATQSKAEVAGTGFVQVGASQGAAAAQQMAKKIQRMGLPVRIGRYTRNGQTSRLVIAGPFGGQRDVARAVSRLRSAGYDAFAR